MKLFHGRAEQAASTVSIVEFLRSNVRKDKAGFDPGLKLPDDPQKPGELGWAPGARDGLFGRSHQPDDLARQQQEARVIHRALGSYASRPNGGHQRDLEVALTNAQATAADSLIDLLNASPIPDRTVAHACVRRIVETTGRRDVLKLSLVLLGHVGDSKDNDLLRLIGMHGEFTLYAAVVIEALNPDPVPVLLEVSAGADGWGRVAMIVALLRHLNPEVRAYLLREAFTLFDLGGEVALDVANQCRLLDALQGAGRDAELIRGIGRVLHALATAHHGSFNDYPESAPATVEWLAEFEPVASTLSDYEMVLDLIEWLKFDLDSEGPAASWSSEERNQATSLAHAILDKPEWRGQVLRALDDPKERWRAVRVAGRLGIPTRHLLMDWLRQDPLNSSWWFSLTKDQSPAEMDEALALASELLDLPALSSGPASSLGVGPEFARHQCVDYLLASLEGYPPSFKEGGRSGFPGKGEDLILASLASPVTRNRHLALRVLDRWSPSMVTSRLLSTVEGMAHDPDPNVRASAARLVAELQKPANG